MKNTITIIAIFSINVLIAGCATVPQEQYDRCKIRGETFCLSTNNALDLSVTVTLGPDYNFYQIYDTSREPAQALLGSILESQHLEIDQHENPEFKQTSQFFSEEKVLVGELTENDSTKTYFTRDEVNVGDTTHDNLVVTVVRDGQGFGLENLYLCSVFGASQRC